MSLVKDVAPPPVDLAAKRAEAKRKKELFQQKQEQQRREDMQLRAQATYQAEINSRGAEMEVDREDVLQSLKDCGATPQIVAPSSDGVYSAVILPTGSGSTLRTKFQFGNFGILRAA